MSLSSTETDVFNNIITKMDKIKNQMIEIRDYTQLDNGNLQIDYLEKLSQFSIKLNELVSLAQDVKDNFIMQSDSRILTETDLNEQKNLRINKKIQDTFLPYMLYLQILLQNNSNDN